VDVSGIFLGQRESQKPKPAARADMIRSSRGGRYR
jgi:hypothetical protein